MSSFENRPYVGTYAFNKHKTVKYTPDCMVYFNGELELPGCSKCKGKIDFQEFITQVSVDCGTDTGASSSTISLSIPKHHHLQVARDAQPILYPGLEVHIYMRGYFPAVGVFENVSPEETDGVDITKIPTYPYYHVFHGVTTQVDFSFSGGFQNVSITCAGMLHFWQYHQMSTSASYFGDRPDNSNNKVTLVGNNFNGLTPYAIMYKLHTDTAGAAGGVGFALSAKNNQKAKSTVTDESLWSLNIKYWQERFSTKMYNLRMYGVNGELFNAAQAAFVGRLSGSALLSITQASQGTSNKKNALDLFGKAKALGLVQEVTDPITGNKFNEPFSFGPSSASDSGVISELNIASIQAFVQDIGQLGSLNTWESEYSTKLEVANAVCEVSGFEFYQDVDGDLVFKPPLYNLNTKESRIYRIEDIDIIDISFTHKEPEATYVTCKGGYFKNLTGAGVENEYGVRGQYIDYRLVAMYGWRNQSFDTNYFNNPRDIFYAAVNRLDLLNVQMHGASITVPLRPEIRPGYPVYIRHLDSYFYLTSLSHSFNFSGACTTSLQLVGKRSKFFAPGKVNERGIKSIVLDKTELPKKPLQIIDNNGRPRLSGFPNVVMALDPEGINPLYFAVGSDLEDLSSPIVIRNLIEFAKQYNIIDSKGQLQIDEVRKIKLTGKDQEELKDIIGEGDLNTINISLDFNGLSANFDKFRSAELERKSAEISIKELENTIAYGEIDLESKELEANVIPNTIEKIKKEGKSEAVKIQEARLEEVKADIKKLKAALEKQKKSLSEIKIDPLIAASNAARTSQIKNLQAVIFFIKQKYLIETGLDFMGDGSTKRSSYLDLISDKKASFADSSVPGFYRYYSSSHPDPNQQGQKILKYTNDGPAGGGEDQKLPARKKVKGFLPVPTKPAPNGIIPEAEIGEVEVVNGLRVILNGKKDKIVPTSDIKSLTFAKHELDVSVDNQFYKVGEVYTGLGQEFYTKLKDTFLNVAGNSVNLQQTVENIFKPTWDSFVSSLENSPEELKVKTFPDTFSVSESITFEKTETILNIQNKIYKTYSPFVIKMTLQFIAKNVQEDLKRKIDQYFKNEWDKIEEENPSYKNIEESKSLERLEKELSFNTKLKTISPFSSFTPGQFVKTTSVSAGELKRTVKDKKGKDVVKNYKVKFYTPIFPVSDEEGYEVVGSYRYGRGLDILGSASIQTVITSDPFRFAKPEDIEYFVDTLKGKTGENLEIQIPTKKNKKKKSEANITEPLVFAASDAENKVYSSLLSSIYFNPETPSILVETIKANAEAGLAENLLSNFIETSKEFSKKIPVTNIAYSLADIQVTHKGGSCNCKAEESYITIEAFSQDNFIEIVPSDQDKIYDFIYNETIIKGEQSKDTENILRGLGPRVQKSSQGITGEIRTSLLSFPTNNK